MSWFFKSFEEKVKEAADKVFQMNLGVRNFDAKVDAKTVTLQGEADTLEVKTRVMEEFNKLIRTENTVNQIRVTAPKPVEPPKTAVPLQAEAPIPAPSPTKEEEQWYVVQAGDTLSGLAKRFYGKGNLYMKIFEANKDLLKDPNVIKVGQRLRIPKLDAPKTPQV